jgi:hypothetical protein
MNQRWTAGVALLTATAFVPACTSRVTVPDYAVVVELRDPKGAACAAECIDRTFEMAAGEDTWGRDQRAVWQATCFEQCPTSLRHGGVDCRSWRDDRSKVCGAVTRVEKRDRSWIAAVVVGGVVVLGAVFWVTAESMKNGGLFGGSP